MKLSVVIIAKNEQANIVDCLRSVVFADEIIVIDDFSDDETVRLAEEAGAAVYQRQMNGGWSDQQNFAISKANGKWLLLLDCDERITPILAEEILQVIDGESYAYQIQRFNHFAGKRVKYGVLRSDWVCRLLPNNSTVRFEGKVHPQLHHPFEERRLKSPMLHHTYTSWSQYYRKFEQYTRLAAEQYAERGERVNILRDFLIRPFWAFFKMYIIHGGFLDGKIGWILSVNHYHYTLTKYTRLYSIQQLGKDTL